MKPSGRSLEIVAVGLGQAGGNIAAEFHRRGYRGLAFNTAQTDLTSLGASRLALPESQRIYIGLEGSDGAGSDTHYGTECVTENADLIRKAVEEHAVGADVVALCAGLGGGTGSCVAELTKVIEDLSLPVVILTALPHHHESGIAKVNALRAIRDLSATPAYGWVLIDNARLAQGHQDVPLDSYFETINREIVEPIDVFNRLNDRDSAQAIRTLDGEDFRTLLFSGGVLSYHTEELPELNAEGVLDSVRGAIGENPMMPKDSDMKDVSYLGLVIEASERALTASPFSLYEKIVEQLKRETGGAAVYIGLYRNIASDDATATVRMISASQALPASIDDMLEEATREADTIQSKVQQTVKAIDLGSLDQLRLRRHAVPRGPRVPNRPAPLAEKSTKAPTKDMPRLADVLRQPGAEAEAEAAPDAPESATTVGELYRRLGRRGPKSKATAAREKAAAAKPRARTRKVDELRRMVAVGEPEAPASEAPASEAPAGDGGGVVTSDGAVQDRYERLAHAFRDAKNEKRRLDVARELVAAQRSGDPTERFYAVNAMTRVDAAYFRDALADAAKDDNRHVAGLAQRALDALADVG
ncbi:MAG: hypothetical protein AAF430_05565 [Myxococcota bacterium]